MSEEKTVELWERQPGEGEKPWEAFVTYRDMGGKRSNRLVAEKLGKSETIINRWSSQWNWVDRLAAWSNEQDRIIRESQIAEIAEMRKRHAELAVAMIEKAKAALELMEPEELSAVTLAKFVDAAVKIERLSRGDTSEVIEERDGGEAESPVQFYIPDNSRN